MYDFRDILIAIANKEPIQFNYDGGDTWIDIKGETALRYISNDIGVAKPANRFRVATNRLKVGDVTIREPYRERPPLGTMYYVPNDLTKSRCIALRYHADTLDEKYFNAGFAFKSKDDCMAFINAIEVFIKPKNQVDKNA